MPVTPRQVSQAFVQLMPQILRGVALDFFIRRGVTQTQFLVLMAIHATGRSPMGVLARNMQVSMPTATGIVDRLAQAAFVRRSPKPEDRRQVLVELTPKGRQFLRGFHRVIRRRWEEVLRSLTAQEMDSFYRVLTKLRDRLRPDVP